MGSFLKRNEAAFDSKDFKFLKEKAKGLENVKFQIEAMGNGKFLLTEGASLVPFRIVGFNTQRKWEFAVNNHELEYGPGQDISQLWRMIEEAMPQKSAFLWSLLIPRAEAQVAMGIGVTIIAGVVAWARDSATCGLYRAYRDECKDEMAGKTDFPDMVIEDAHDFDREGRLSFTCGEDKKAMRECLIQLAHKYPDAVPNRMADFFHVPGHPDFHTEPDVPAPLEGTAPAAR